MTTVIVVIKYYINYPSRDALPYPNQAGLGLF